MNETKPCWPEKPSTSSQSTARSYEGLPSLPPVRLAGKMTANGYQPENWQWMDILTEPHPTRSDSGGKPKRMGRDPMTLPLEVLRASGHPQRRAAAVRSALGDEPMDPSIRSLTELRRHCLSCAENSAEVRRCAIIDCPLWPYRMGRNPHNPRRGVIPLRS